MLYAKGYRKSLNTFSNMHVRSSFLIGLTMVTSANYFRASVKMQERVWSPSLPVSLTISLISTRIRREHNLPHKSLVLVWARESKYYLILEYVFNLINFQFRLRSRNVHYQVQTWDCKLSVSLFSGGAYWCLFNFCCNFVNCNLDLPIFYGLMCMYTCMYVHSWISIWFFLWLLPVAAQWLGQAWNSRSQPSYYVSHVTFGLIGYLSRLGSAGCRLTQPLQH